MERSKKIPLGSHPIQHIRVFWAGAAFVILAMIAALNLGPVRSHIHLLRGNAAFERAVGNYGQLGHTAFWEQPIRADQALAEAKTQYEWALQYNPKNASVLLMLARTYTLQGDLGRATESYQNYSKAKPHDPLGTLELGFVLERLCNPDGISEAINTVSNLNTTCDNTDLLNRIQSAWNAAGVRPSEFITRGSEVWAAGNADLAIVWYQRAALLDPGSGAPWFEIAKVLDSEGRAEGAMEALNHSGAIDPAFRDSWYALGQVFERASDWQAAADAYERGLEGTHGTIGLSNLEFRLGRILLMEFDPPDIGAAMGAFTDAIRLDEYTAEPWQRSEAYHRRGNISAQLGNLSDAIVDYEAALSHDPRHYWVHLSMARAHWERGAKEDAIGWANAAAAISPELKNAFSLLGAYYRQTDQIELSIQSYLRVLEIDPEDPQARIQLDQLESQSVEAP